MPYLLPRPLYFSIVIARRGGSGEDVQLEPISHELAHISRKFPY